MTNEALWKPSNEQIQNSNMTEFMEYVNQKYDKDFNTYTQLFDWSVEDIESFWEAIWDRSEIVHSEKYNEILGEAEQSELVIPRPAWFKGAKLNFAENLLKKDNDEIAIIHYAENQDPLRITYKELRLKVAKVAFSLKLNGIKKGDVVGGFITNCPEAVIGMLATTSLGAVWTSCSPDFGHQGVIDRFGQVKPKVIFAVNGYKYNGKDFSTIELVSNIASEIEEVEKVVVIKKIEAESISNPKFITWEKCSYNDAEELHFVQVDFDHPVYIMYSSGTTGTPKCIVHGVGGTLIQHWKEHYLHTNLNDGDTLSYFTTCGWMMWNWLVSGLQVGAKIFLFDGSPSYPTMNVLFDAVDKEKINVFGTSPKFLATCQKARLNPRETNSLDSLKVILSTGSPLTSENYNYVYQQIKPDVQLSSISGGTDIIGCFALGNPILPVYSEELQCRGLGMNVRAWDENKQALIDEQGELVCLSPFPSMPIYFFNDEKNEKYYNSYFNYFDHIWRHGDFIKVTQNGGIIVLGRSDATLNPGGVRIGTAEIYRVVESVPEIKDSVVIGQKWQDDIRIILFVVMQDGVVLDNELKTEIKAKIKEEASPRHVPKKIKEITEVPVTISGKKVEIAITKILNGEEVLNKSALKNPESLDQFYQLSDLLPRV